MQFICCALIIVLVSLEYISKYFYFRELSDIAIIVYDRIIVKYVKWVFTEVHYSSRAYLVTVLLVSGVFLILFLITFSFVNHPFVKCFITFHLFHSSCALSFNFAFSNFVLVSSLIHTSVASVFALIFNFPCLVEDFIMFAFFSCI